MLPLVAFALVFIVCSSWTTALQAPLYRSSLSRSDLTPEQRLQSLVEQQRATRRKFGLKIEAVEDDPGGQGLERRQQGTEPLAGVQGVYNSLLTLGTPAVEYSVLLDTGSSDLIILTPRSLSSTLLSSSDPCSPDCFPSAALYSPSDSSTSQLNESAGLVQIKFGTGSARGPLVSDEVTFAGFSARLNLIAATRAEQLTATSSPSGLLGLGWQGLSASGSTPLVQGLWEDGQVGRGAETGFALRSLGGEENATDVVAGGVFSLGQPNASLFTGPLKYTPLSSSSAASTSDQLGFWSIPLTSITFNGQQVQGSNAQAAVIDTGTNSIALPSTVASSIYAFVPGAVEVPRSNGLFGYPCSVNFELSLTLADTTFSINSAQFNSGLIGRSSSGVQLCAGAVTGLGSTAGGGGRDVWIIGTPFLSAYYSSFRFDPPAVGFADLASGVEQALATGEVPLPSGVSSAMRSNGAGRGYLIAVTMAMMGIVLRSDERNGSDVQ